MPQADVISRVDEELRAEMVETQALVARFATEQKHYADSVALAAQRTLETDKGARNRAARAFTSTPLAPAHPPVPAPVRREPGAAAGGARVDQLVRGRAAAT